MNIASKKIAYGAQRIESKIRQKNRLPIGQTEQLIKKCNLSPPAALPISKSWNEIAEAITRHQVIIVVGETGSGKTTQIPKICLAAGLGIEGRIAVTQPRRVAAITMARRLATELGPIGSGLVGYKIRFKDRCPPHSRIWFVTDGLLLAQLPNDPKLMAYDTVIVDEAHERSLNIDFLLGVLRGLLPERPEMRVVVTSATLDASKFAKAFNDPPVIKVEGRGFPVDIVHLDPRQLGIDEGGPADLAIEAVRMIRQKDVQGHILVFLPTEQSILEGVKVLQGEIGKEAMVLPMFGRLSAREQARIFEPSSKQKIVLSTNVAETSITVPGIRYVVDTGLARISQYNPGTRTKALPVSKISQSSADQRAGRAGRTGPGICIRLYSEEDYLARPKHTLPEILRSNLAEVVLRLKYLRLGNPEDFPFIDQPSPKAIKEAETTLKLLGALNEKGELTKIGKLMARLPLDPRISKMILEARRWNCVNEILTIAAALSIQDPRERPSDKHNQADQAHQCFLDKHSDFITYLKIWGSYQELFKQKSSRKERIAFCKEHFLSFRRMEEWIDARNQIKNILEENGSFPMNRQAAGYEEIHRAILPGLLDQIACKKKGALYLGARGREIYLFPGSSLYKTRPDWIVTADITRTSKLFARTAAMIEPKWLEEAGRRFIKKSYSNPHWEKRRGEVIAFEKATLFGLTLVERRKVSYSHIEPEDAHDVFVRQALVPCELNKPFDFVKRNIFLLRELEDARNRLRQNDLMVDEEALASFYRQGLRKLLKKVLKKRDKKGNPLLSKKKIAKLSYLSRERDLSHLIKLAGTDTPLHLSKDLISNRVLTSKEMAMFPGHLCANGHELPLKYRFETGNERDGVSVQIPVELINEIDSQIFDWLVPGLLEEKILYLLKGLPGRIRKEIVPIGDTASKAMHALNNAQGSLYRQLQAFLRREFGISVSQDMWPKPHQMPWHLSMRFEIVDKNKRIIAYGRDLSELKRRLSKAGSDDTLRKDERWLSLQKKWERKKVNTEFLDEIPSNIQVKIGETGRTIRAWVGMVSEDSGTRVASRLFLNKEQALKATKEALTAMTAKYLSKELRDILEISVPKDKRLELLAIFPDQKALMKNVTAYILGNFLKSWDEVPDKEEFLKEMKRLKATLFKDSLDTAKSISKALSAGLRVKALIQKLYGKRPDKAHSRTEIMNAELTRLLPADFPLHLGHDHIRNLSRYLKALEIRVQRAYADPSKDAKKQAQLEAFISKLMNELESTGFDTKRLPPQVALALEEYRIAVFAPEIGTLFPVSEKRILETLHKTEI